MTHDSPDYAFHCLGQAHITERNERQDEAAELITGRGIEIVFQTSGAFRDDWDYGDFNEDWSDHLFDVVFSRAFH